MLGIPSLGSGVGHIAATISLTGEKQFMNSLHRVDSSVRNSSNLISTGFKAAVIAGTIALTAMVGSAASFESKMTDVFTLLGKDGKEAFQAMKSDVLALSLVVPQSANELSSALYQIVSATVPASEAMNVLKVSSEAAVGGVSDATSTFNLFSSIIKGYGKEWKEVGDVSDIVFQTIKLGQTTMEELAASMGGAIPIANFLGIDLKELAGATATLSGVTGNTSEVMTQLEGIMTMLSKKPTRELREAFEALGVASGKELVEKFGSLAGAMQALTEYAKNNNMQVSELIGRKEALVGFLALTGEQADIFAEKTRAMGDAVGSAKEAFDKQMDTLKNLWKVLKNQVKAAFIEMGDNALPVMKNMLKYLKQHPEVIKSVVKVFGTLAIALGGLVVVWKVVSAVSAAWVGLGLAKVVGTLTTALGSSSIAANLFAGAAGLVAAKVVLLATAIFLAAKNVGNLITAISNFISAKRHLKEVTEEFEHLKTVSSTAFESMQNALWELGHRGPQEMVKMNQSVMTVEEAMSRINVLLSKSAKEGREFYTDIKLSFDDLEPSVKKVGDRLLAIEEYEKELKDAGYVLTREIEEQRKQIDEWLKSAGSDLVLTMQLRDKKKELTEQLIPMTKEYSNLRYTKENYLGVVKDLTEEEKKLLDASNELLNDTGSLNKEWVRGYNVLMSMVEAIPGLSSEMHTLIKVFDVAAGQISEFGKLVNIYDLLIAGAPLVVKGIILIGEALENNGKFFKESMQIMEQHRQEWEAWVASQKMAEEAMTSIGMESMDQINLSGNYITSELGNAFKTWFNATQQGFKDTADSVNEVNEAVEEVTDSLSDQQEELKGLIIQWERLYQIFFEEFTQFEDDIRTATEAIEKLLYFKIDLDTTDVDEQIGVAISRMIAYLNTLDPSSEAYADARKALQDLVDLYDKLGKPIKVTIDVGAKLSSEVKRLQEPGAFDNIFISGGSTTRRHSRGLLKAHDGLLLSDYKGRKEIPFVGLENEFVLKPEITEAYGAGKLRAFNETGNADYLNQAKGRETKVIVELHMHQQTPGSWGEITRSNILPAMDEVARATAELKEYK